MMKTRGLGRTLFCMVLLVAGCSSPSTPTDQSAADAPTPKPEPAQAQEASPVPPPEATAATPAPLPEAPAAVSAPVPETRAAAPASPPAPPAAPVEAAPAPPPSAAAPAATAAVVDKGGPVAVAATKPGLSHVGSDTCEMCHDVQFASWAQSAHAARKPQLDCESCHGPGSEYKAMANMKDPAKARAAGLVIPEQSFCAQCHNKGVNADLLKRAHAHEE
jgi:hypothetical protein